MLTLTRWNTCTLSSSNDDDDDDDDEAYIYASQTAS
jgi:hypothetical protein